ncbi:hypothetical protein SAMN05421858_3277 [Haladaptatus litoreus]|uniref:Uncharacterized protein n=2 Tax=Haladaptatus litoreus TaxID=553468 RepID=A0A1N7CVM6_9EURY|nr:hypothetical protein SAMN05421858_3277 [Haladaptatus litoreus]
MLVISAVILFLREAEVGVTLVFPNVFEFVPIDSDPDFVDVVGKQVGTFLKFTGLQLIDPFVTYLRLADGCVPVGLRFVCFVQEICDLPFKLVDPFVFLLDIRLCLSGGKQPLKALMQLKKIRRC